MKLYTLLAALFIVSSMHAMDEEIHLEATAMSMDLWHEKLKDWVVGIKLFSKSEHSNYYSDCTNLPEEKRYVIWCLSGKSLLDSLDSIVIKALSSEYESDALEQVKAIDDRYEN